MPAAASGSFALTCTCPSRTIPRFQYAERHVHLHVYHSMTRRSLPNFIISGDVMRLRILLLCLCVLLLVTAGWAQETTGTIAGTAKDSTGAVVASASVTVRNVGTGLTRKTQT